MTDPRDDARRRSERARQVISGGDIRSPGYGDHTVAYEEESFLSGPQWIYFAILFSLFALTVITYLVFGGGVASVFVFLMALLLFAGWLVF